MGKGDGGGGGGAPFYSILSNILEDIRIRAKCQQIKTNCCSLQQIKHWLFTCGSPKKIFNLPYFEAVGKDLEEDAMLGCYSKTFFIILILQTLAA